MQPYKLRRFFLKKCENKLVTPGYWMGGDGSQKDLPSSTSRLGPLEMLSSPAPPPSRTKGKSVTSGGAQVRGQSRDVSKKKPSAH